MQIVIPMSGFGERFRKAGYSIPKPLIVIDGKTIIQHVIEMFPGENDITFICNKDHLNEKKYRMGEILKAIAPQSKIIQINPHKLGPVHAVLKAIDAAFCGGIMFTTAALCLSPPAYTVIFFTSTLSILPP